MEGTPGLSTDYKPVRAKKLSMSKHPFAAEARFWKSFVKKDILQHVTGITCIHFCPKPPHDFAVTSSTRVCIYDGDTCQLKKTIARFSDVAYSGVLRSDGQLLAAGGETGTIQVFDVNSRLVLRHLKGHKRAVHWVRYSPEDKLHLLSGSDDNTVRWWDVTIQEELLKLEGHTDYVRCGSSNPSSTDLWATGSYDHTVRLWDLRTSKTVLQLQHGQPLEDVLFFPSGGLLATAGGNFVKIWDVLGGGRLIQVLGSHQKTVTSLQITSPVKPSPTLVEASPRLLTASLDGHVKVYELNKFKVTHASKYAAPILSMDVSLSNMTMAVGTSTGLLFVRQRKNLVQCEDSKIDQVGIDGLQTTQRSTGKGRILRSNNYRYFLRGQTERASDGDYYVLRRRKLRFAEHDKLFRRFRYKEALMASLRTSNPTVVVAVMEELVTRRGLISAISNLDASSLELLLNFIRKYIAVPKYSRLLVPFSHKVLDKCASDFGTSSSIIHQVEVLREKVALELRLQMSLQAMQGLIQPLLHASVQ
eukprot:c25310_g1_i1 orf=329-1921(-)